MVLLLWTILTCLRIASHHLSLNEWRVLASLSVLNHILGISPGLEELAYLYEMQRDGDETVSFFPREYGRYLVSIVVDYEEK